MDLSKKGLGKQGTVPRLCPVCGREMSKVGWGCYGDRIYCFSCRNYFWKGEVREKEKEETNQEV